MRSKTLHISILAGLLALSSCASPPTREDTGMVIGGILGGVAGRQIGEGGGQAAATIIGAIAGAAIGGAIGRSMDEQDRLRTALALENVRTGVPTTWRNPDSGYQYTVTPTRTFDSGTGPCREYTMKARIGGKPEQVYGTACRQPDGSWRIMD